ncbi:threonine/serine dehydratase [Alteromonas sediminis]|uniref:Threonine/serine dehydratase n=1 Tax=Alteromonas sediminis TaxID=2259342 RepID=A0A3N5Y0E7_9ALTE|nr:threonine/serine dehydratase [Alteromonas sediminis]RPJ66343.1 threonine/serine dehydratase [Alteromonas sediminis]
MINEALCSYILQAKQRFDEAPVSPLKTPCVKSYRLSQEWKNEVWLKLENQQYTGSFKFRGALNKILSLTHEQKRRGVITASSGNHGFGCAYAAASLDIPLTVCVPDNAAKVKCDNISRLGAQLIKVNGDCLVAEQYAQRLASQEKKTYISPYNDWAVMAGQGTIGIELLDTKVPFDAVFIAVGGGGLIGGIGTIIKSVSPHTDIIGCWPQHSTAMASSLDAGQVIEVEEQPTLSDGTAGGIEANTITFDICQSVIDKKVLVEEQLIASTIKSTLALDNTIIEGAAAVAIAGAYKLREQYQGKRIAIVVCGKNISFDTLKSIINTPD